MVLFYTLYIKTDRQRYICTLLSLSLIRLKWFCNSLSLSPPPSLSLSPLSLSLPISHPPNISPSQSLPLSPSLPISISPSQSLSLPLSLSFSLSLARSLSFSMCFWWYFACLTIPTCYMQITITQKSEVSCDK